MHPEARYVRDSRRNHQAPFLAEPPAPVYRVTMTTVMPHRTDRYPIDFPTLAEAEAWVAKAPAADSLYGWPKTYAVEPVRVMWTPCFDGVRRKDVA